VAITLTIISWLVLIGFLGLGAWKIRSGQTAVGVVLVVITLLAWPIWQWVRPHVAYANITGTEVKREDHDQNVKTPSRDVRYIYANDGRDRQFRNEDSWAWFKLNSDDTFGRAKRLEDSDQKVWIVYYGLRSNLLSWHPNVISVTERFPVVSTVRLAIFYGLSAVFWGGLAWGALKFGRSERVAGPSSS
jgi:hypothetical protein